MITYSSFDDEFIDYADLVEAIKFWESKSLTSSDYNFDFWFLTLNIPNHLITEADGKVSLEVFAHNKTTDCGSVSKTITLPIVRVPSCAFRWKASYNKEIWKIRTTDLKAALEILSATFSDFRKKCESLAEIQNQVKKDFPQFDFKLKFNDKGICFSNITYIEAYSFICTLRGDSSVNRDYLDEYEKYVDSMFTSACFHSETDSHSSYYSTLYDCTIAPEVLTYKTFIKVNEAELKMNALRRNAGNGLKEKLDKLNKEMTNND